jgi:hypothetical protein
MDYILGALAVYKITHVLDMLTPKEAMPWVKVVFSLLVSFIIAFVLGIPNIAIAGCAIATLAGTVHALIRLITLVGDMTQRKTLR